MESELNELMQVRRQKLEELKNKGIDPFGQRYDRTHLAKDILTNFEQMEN